MTANGLITIQSRRGPEDTLNQLEAAVRAGGMSVFAHIDHAAGATAAGLALRQTELLIFGNARDIVPLMQAVPTSGIDLPLKVLVWQDGSGDTWVTYNDMRWLASRHGLSHGTDATLGAAVATLEALVKTVTV